MANTPINAMTATFGSGDQTAIKMNVSDVGPSNSNSKLIDLQLGSVTKFKVTKRGEVIATNYTGSFSGSNFIKDQSGVAGTKYLLFSNGSGQRTVGYDTSLSYDASSNTLTTNGSVNTGGDIDSTNLSPLLLSSPTTIGFGSSATTIRIGSTSAGGYTRFDSKQVRGNFTGSFTGSFSGSKGKFTKISGSNVKITGRVTANSFTGSISGGYAAFTNIRTGTFTANSFTGSISGSRANFTKISGSGGLITGRFKANSFTGSISGSRANFTKISGSGGLITGRFKANSFTGSISGGYAAFTNISGGYADFTNISGGYANFTKISGSGGLITGRFKANSFTGSISGGYASITEITGSSGRIENNLVIEGSLQLNNSITGSNNMFISGAGSPIAGYVGIMIGGVKYKMPLYPWT